MNLYSPTVDRDGNPGSQPSPFKPDLDWPEGEIPFLSPEEEKSFLETAARQAEQAAQETYDADERRRQTAREKFRREREQAEIDGTLAPEAELFRDARLKPRVTEAHDFEVSVRTPIVQGHFFKNSLTWIAGTSGTFKSFVTADLAFRYGAEDMDYHGMRMTHGRALLIVAEGAAAYADRKAAWERQHDRQVKNVSIYPAPIQLGDTLKEMPALLSYLAEEREAGRPFDLIIFDTQAMCTIGIDENSSEMNLIVNVLHRVREVNQACVMVVHHFGKNKSAGMRGSSMIYAAADTVCVLKRQDDALDVSLSTAQADEGKQKDAIAEKDFLTLEMRSHAVGEDFFGDPVFSLVPMAGESGGREMTDEEVEEALHVPTVTDKQLPYLQALSFYREHGEKQTAIAKRMAEEYGIKTYGSLVRSTMIALEDKKLTRVGTDGCWRITPLGNAVILRVAADRADLEQSWVDRKARRPKVPSGVSEGQRNLDLGTPGTLSEPTPETPSDLQRNLGT